MPVARYFLLVGGVLLALLFALDAFVPPQVAVAGNNAGRPIDKTVVRIRSDQKLPERVVYDTSLPTIVPPVSSIQIASAPASPAAGVAVQARVRDTFAQFVPVEAKKLEKQPQASRKRRIAKSRSAQPMRFAQQQHFGFFGSGTW